MKAYPIRIQRRNESRQVLTRKFWEGVYLYTRPSLISYTILGQTPRSLPYPRLIVNRKMQLFLRYVVPQINLL